MNALILGSGAREHAIAWKLKPSCENVYLHPGNAGTLGVGFANLGNANGVAEICQAAKKAKVSLIVIGPEALLAQDYATQLRSAGFLVVGPNQQSAQLETSKIYSKEFMQRAKLPTAEFRVASQYTELQALLSKLSFPIVLKLDGLAAGKGVVIAKTADQALHFAERVWKKKEFGPLPQKVLIEDFIVGVELSYLGLCDGKHFTPLSSSTDFKRIFDNDQGPNTGGMGAMSPSPYLNEALEAKIQSKIVDPILRQLQIENLDYRGVLYIGIMIDKANEPFVLEFNARFGDPETQSLMLRIDGDFIPHLVATAQGKLGELPGLKWKKEPSVYVVAAAEGYPDAPKLGATIETLRPLSAAAQLFYAGVKEDPKHPNQLATHGGRVLGVGALGKTMDEARAIAYENLSRIKWTGMQYRTDIGSVRERT